MIASQGGSAGERFHTPRHGGAGERARRLSLRGLPAETRAWAVLLLAVVGLTAVLLASIGLAALRALLEGTPMPDAASLGLPLGTVETGIQDLLPVAALALLYGGSAIVAAAAGHGIGLPAWPFPRATAVGVAWVGASASCLLLVQVPALEVLKRSIGSVGPTVTLALILGWAGLVCAVAFGLTGVAGTLPSRPGVAVARIRPFLAGAPFACLLMALLLADDSPAGPGTTNARGLIAEPGVLVFDLLGMATAVVALWGTLALAMTARRIGDRLAPAGSGAALRVLLVLLGLKGAWIVAGSTGFLPAELPALRVAWEASRSDGAIAWTIAFALAFALVLLFSLPRRVSETGVRASTWVLVLGLVLASLGAALLMVGLPIVLVVAPASYVPLVTTIRTLREAILASQIAVLLVVPLLGLLLWRSGHRSAAILLGVVAAWCLPRTLSVLSLVAGPPGTDASIPALHVEPVTLDAALTVALAIATVGHLRGRNPALPPRPAIVLLVTISLVTFAGLLVPADLEHIAFYALLVYPVVWSLGFDARAANVPGRGRPARVLVLLGTMAGLLVLATLPVVTGQLEDVSDADLARVLLLLPFAAVMVLAWWGREQRLPSIDAPAPWADRSRRGVLIAFRRDRVPRQEAVRWAGLGLMAVALVVALSWLDARGQPQLVAVGPGEIRFGAQLETLEHLVVEPSDAFEAGMSFAFLGHLRRATEGTLTFRVERVDEPSEVQEAPWSIKPGEVWVPVRPQDVLSGALGTFAIEFRDGEEVLARGTYRIVEPSPSLAAAGRSIIPERAAPGAAR